ncbi:MULTISPECIES: ornithine--oxo-acid transaminase [unclassified Pseudodesulfovibrio]|uniref:ornithine--oxo-acid transaminase n=1 Tax=unclassified Pseudodesulfovibrio TaxID=2661612 RepID=UPI000FEC14E2|nr:MULTISPECIES: ornithine--oxo-acid transaminase [unclassified Pseudodesulfovibrio]MCJ2166278.1 ornithine--oxo-acid transaminase [Pseudodesulfovibrio sp. S3-i]RWU02263.1 ornithine--oxo-acid transaminase [Pseudodesulfovibrio sp. S3]
MKSDQYILLEDEFGAHNYKPLDVVIERGSGIWVWDVNGKKYMDCLSAYSAVNQGHCNPKIMEAMVEQAKKLTLTSRAFRNDQLGPLYKELCDLTNSHKVLPMNSGAEAVETAIKAVRKWGYQVKNVPEDKAEIIVCRNNFHGRTITIISFSTDPVSTTGFGPFTPGFKVVDFGDAKALENAINENTVAFLVEPIQGEAGVIIPPRGYLKDVRRICDQAGIVLIFDEIQTGLGRTGKMLAEEHEGVEADLTLIGKALSGGFYPVSAVLSNTEVLGVLKPGEHGSTFGGNPLACAVARAALKVLKDDNLIDNARDMGAYFMDGLKRIDNPKIKEVRGRGLLIGLEFHKDAGGARQYCEKLKEAGLLCKETHETIIRFAPPLVITKEDIDWALERITPILSQ